MGTVYLIGNGAANFIPWFSDAGGATVECWGGGQAGNGSTFAGGSGAYWTKSTGYTLTNGTPVPFSLGAPGITTAQAGGDTWWSSAATQIAPGGGSATTPIGGSSNAGGAGGTAGGHAIAGGGGAGGPHGTGNAGGSANQGAGSNGGAGGGGGNGGGTAGTTATGQAGGNGGNGFNGTGGAGGASSGQSGAPGGNGAGGGGGWGNQTSGSGSGGAGGDDYDNGGGGGGASGSDSSVDTSSAPGGTPGGGGSGFFTGDPGNPQGGWSTIKITSTNVTGSYFFTYGGFTSSMLSSSFLMPFSPPNVAAPIAWMGTPIGADYVSAQSGNDAPGGTGISSVTATVGTAISAGNTAIVYATGAPAHTNPTTWTASDNVSGNTYSLLTTTVDGSGNSCAIWLGLNIQNGPTQFTVNFGSPGSDFPAVVVDTFSGVVSASALDVTGAFNDQTNPGTGTNAITSGNFTPTLAGELLYAVTAGFSGGNTVTVGTGWTLAQGNIEGAVFSEYILVGTASLQAGTFTDATNGGAQAYATVAIALKIG